MISYHKRVGYIWHGYEKVYFDSKNKEHINWVINNLISDIDSRLRYRIKNYFSNYFLLVSNKNGIEVAGKDWSQYLEYGTTDKTIIDLQNIGLSRHVAMIIKENYEDVLVYDDQELANIDFKMLFQIIDKQKFKHEYNELIAMFED